MRGHARATPALPSGFSHLHRRAWEPSASWRAGGRQVCPEGQHVRCLLLPATSHHLLARALLQTVARALAGLTVRAPAGGAVWLN